jgi:peroxiredoxin
MKRKGIVALGLAAVLAAGVALFRMQAPAQAPALTLYALDGRAVHLAELRGKPLLITFWATTCPACVKEIPHLSALYQELKPRGLEIIGIAMAYDPPHYVLRMTRQHRIPYPIVLDPLGEAAKAFGDVQLTPSSFLVSPQGRIIQRRLGAWDMEALRETLLTLL